ncbi:tetratricopeptide repeat protein [Salinimonas chungwhensis]|uniref:tetratricopeptide repeat protein n=1 Tax=Salinimonas chungwhensis TaxID=265425 RepID=UPI000363DDC8|nr:tetratricopeptide repeat protein [Salinimonas chungwhensis]
MQILRTTALVTALCFSLPALAQEKSSLLDIQHKWAKVNYGIDNAKQLGQFESLIEQARELVAASPNNAAALTWLGIAQASAARAKGGLGALDFAENARENFEKAIEIEPSSLNGTALFSLAALYYKVPGWPVSFGDVDKAEKLFKDALAIHPKGIDPNYFYAEYLYEEGNYESAYRYLQQALQADPRPNRPLADSGRREAVKTLLKKVTSKRS